MLSRVLRDLTVSDLTFGGGPLVLAVLAFVKAARVDDDAYARWSWIACGVIMLVVCAAYAAWVWRRRDQLPEE